jgi:YD repeat-containing protein
MPVVIHAALGNAAFAQGSVPVLAECRTNAYWGANLRESSMCSPQAACARAAQLAPGLGAFVGLHFSYPAGIRYCEFSTGYYVSNGPVANYPGNVSCPANSRLEYPWLISDPPSCACHPGFRAEANLCVPEQPWQIELFGRAATRALPAGPVLPYQARVTAGGVPQAGVAVSITGSNGQTLSGSTDANGLFAFTYVPPVQRRSTDTLSAGCAGCMNTATASIQVEAGETCEAPLGNPIQPASGEKQQSEVDWQDGAPHPLTLTRHYRSQAAHAAGWGAAWAHDFAGRLDSRPGLRIVRLGDGSQHLFTEGPAGLWQQQDGRNSLAVSAGGAVFRRSSDDSHWQFDPTGRLLSIAARNGWTYQLAYDTAGNRIRSRNPLGEVTSWTHDASGRALTQTDPGGLASTFTYDPRGRLTSITSAGETTRYAYTVTGQVQAVTLPSGHEVRYGYDAAQRLVAASDNRGASATFVLDAHGNRVREEVRDASGQLALLTTRIINGLNQVAALQGAAGQTTQIGYDANGQPTASTDAMNQTTRQTLDALGRTAATTFADGTQALQAWNQLDQLTRVTDPKGIATGYTSNAFGEVVAESGPDRGSIRYQRDAGGQVISMRDAPGGS